MSKTRLERDSMGELEVPFDALYGAQTQRAVNNFPISGQVMPESFIRALLLVKLSAAQSNVELGYLDREIGDGITHACYSLLESQDMLAHFPVDVFQTGSGTSSNMNANEVIAKLASRASQMNINANDHVNFGQSSNDVIPTSIHVAASLDLHNKLLPALQHLIQTIEEKAATLTKFCKTGRTHLMDAMPVRMDQSLKCWAAQLSEQKLSMAFFQTRIQSLAIGGTAVGTGVNTDVKFSQVFTRHLTETTKVKFTPMNNLFAGISSQDTAVTLSGLTKSLAVTLLKIANDLRWMNSGPLAGLGEITLPALQPGSSIMPGKVNPVIPEAVAMVSAQVIGNDTAITVGGQSGNFELNVMLPLIAHNLLNNISLLTNAAILLADKAIRDFVVNEENLNIALGRNPILVTALNPLIGYAKASEIAKKAYSENRPIIDVAHESTDLSLDELTKLLNPMSLTKGGF
ncbi:lyase family protein [Aestuariibacter sp. A3R04]|uniref:class II fumarate hydratase n=1 Tax=Aestuariibacter sp. A3R04 TaxID=2841571 RepID=UPI001C09561D|nr:class II fumarate hydratase [Aestuariibacter sp. A3R04]MBU3021398.1 class II fumarate hydratase [Aestuariibacter sp. A3R04]